MEFNYRKTMKNLVFIIIFLFVGFTNAQSPFVGLIANNIAVDTEPVTPTVVTPVLYDFVVEDATPTQVNFTSTEDVTGLVATDFIISGRTINSVTIDGDGLGGYFTVSLAFDYWDNNTIRKVGGNNTIVYDFTLEHIVNNITVPTIPVGNYRYVTTSGSDSNGGTNDTSDAWLTLSHAIQTVPSGGYKIWVKAGTYSGDNITDVHLNKGGSNPTATTPLIIEGYITTTGDITSNYYTLTPNSAYPALNSALMPLFDGGDSSTGRFIYNDDTPYTIWKNLQVIGYAEAFRSRFSNVSGQQVINSNIKDIGITTSNYGFAIYWGNATQTASYNRITNTNIINAESNAILADGQHCLMEGVKIYTNTGTGANDAGTDYYYQIEGSNNIVKNCLAFNDGNGGHNGHGFSCKTAGSAVGEEVEYNLIDGCEAVAIQGAFQARHAGARFNVWKNSIARADIPNRKEGTSDNYTGAIDFQSGGDQNVFENLTVHDTHQFIRFNLNGESDTDPDIQTNALIKNCLVYNVKNVITANSVIAGVSAPSGNKLANCTIYNADNMFWQWAGTGSVAFGLNKIEDCIIDDVTALNKDEVVVGWTYDYNNIWSSWATTIGTNSLNVNPNYVDLIDFEPTNDLLVAGKFINNVFFDRNGLERNATLTTIGQVIDSSETP